MRAHLVQLSTAGKQRFIFSSIKRKEVVGASDVIARVDRQWVHDALAEVFPGFSRDWRIEDRDAELLVAGAGGATVVVRDADRGRALVTEVTRRALAEAPGLQVCGVVVPLRWSGAGDLAEAMSRAGEEETAVRSVLPAPDSRFARLPLAEQCATSGMPAAVLHRSTFQSRLRPRSATTMAKRKAYPGALTRLTDVLATGDAEVRTETVERIVDFLGLSAEWVAVVHADGNALGAVFRDFRKLVGDADARTYADRLRELSQGVDACAHAAFREAVAHAGEAAARAGTPVFEGLPAVLPLVLGGDDVTLICDSAIALPLTRVYLERFTAHTQRRLGPLLAGSGRTALGAAAGVAVVKRNYPFHFAYGLAEELVTKEAKQVKDRLGPDRSALAFHVLYDSEAADLDRLRAAATAPDGTRLVAQPYVVGPPVPPDAPGGDWAQGRHWEDLRRRVTTLRRRDEATGEQMLPVGAVHDLRQGQFLGREAAAARLSLLRRRFAALPRLADDLGHLAGFWDPGDGPVSGLVDAWNAAALLAGELPAGEGNEA